MGHAALLSLCMEHECVGVRLCIHVVEFCAAAGSEEALYRIFSWESHFADLLSLPPLHSWHWMSTADKMPTIPVSFVLLLHSPVTTALAVLLCVCIFIFTLLCSVLTLNGLLTNLYIEVRFKMGVIVFLVMFCLLWCTVVESAKLNFGSGLLLRLAVRCRSHCCYVHRSRCKPVIHFTGHENHVPPTQDH